MGNAENGDTRLRVLQIITNLDIGGAQEVVRTLSDYLVQNDCPTVVCTLKDGPLRKDIERLGIPVEVVGGRKYSILAFPLFVRDMLRIQRSLAEIVQRYEINVIQTHLLRMLDFLALTLRRGSEKPAVFWTVHNEQFALRKDQLPGFHWLLEPKRFTHRWLYRIASRWASGFIAVSEDVGLAVRREIGPDEKKVAVILNGVDTRRYPAAADRKELRSRLGFGDDACLIAVVGTLKEQKGHRYLVEAGKEILSKRQNLHFLFIGDGPLLQELNRQAAESGLTERIHFLGNRDDVPDLLAASDLFVLPSLWEGLPMALIEAMASGMPIVATRVSGTQKAIIHEESGLLVPPGDPGELAGAIEVLLSRPERASAMGRAARLRAEKCFSAQAQAASHIALFRQGQESNK